ncbi:MAG: C-GCAxxG-C-C family protein [Acutalibacteraceae bacterium]
MTKGDKAKELFEKGYNCAQSIVGAFCEDYGVDVETATKLSSGFGGGMGRLREVCGAFSGMVMVMNMAYGYSNPSDNKAKTDLYKHIQNLGERFKEANGSIVCRELLGISISGGSPENRTKEYYKKRPCSEICRTAGNILEEYLNEI